MSEGCAHPEAGWAVADGVATCGGCGLRRVVDYRALGPAVEPPDGRAPRCPPRPCCRRTGPGALRGASPGG
ncbi:DUF6255 family natural product biosynthesis protein [Streptomyces sp. I05A-00742]|uniref:DUF6255 family natural product biosynthesis protein n=1 Tax=Streptomyces sp. I05A-00742 TaxID=2732853 RepID=UPI0037D9D24A